MISYEMIWKRIIPGFILRIPRTFMIYRYLTVAPRREMFCLRLNVGRRFIPVLYLFR